MRAGGLARFICSGELYAGCVYYPETIWCVPRVVTFHPRQMRRNRFQDEYDRVGDDDVIVNDTYDVHKQNSVSGTCEPPNREIKLTTLGSFARSLRRPPPQPYINHLS